MAPNTARQFAQPISGETTPKIGAMGKMVGEHLGCSPCGILAVPSMGSPTLGCWPGPEVLLSLLPRYVLNYTNAVLVKS